MSRDGGFSQPWLAEPAENGVAVLAIVIKWPTTRMGAVKARFAEGISRVRSKVIVVREKDWTTCS